MPSCSTCTPSKAKTVEESTTPPAASHANSRSACLSSCSSTTPTTPYPSSNPEASASNEGLVPLSIRHPPPLTRSQRSEMSSFTPELCVGDRLNLLVQAHYSVF